MHVEARGQHWVHSLISLHLIFETMSLTKPGTPPISASSVLGLQVCTATVCFHVVLEIWTQSYGLWGKHFTNWIISLARMTVSYIIKPFLLAASILWGIRAALVKGYMKGKHVWELLHSMKTIVNNIIFFFKNFWVHTLFNQTMYNSEQYLLWAIRWTDIPVANSSPPCNIHMPYKLQP